jgi:general secretion pathway protein L
MSAWQDALQPSMDRLRRGWRGSPLPGFFAWWGGELRSFLPVRWQAALSGGECWHLLERQDGGWSLRRAGDTVPLASVDDALPDTNQLAALRTALATVDREDLRVALCLPAPTVLRRKLALPLAARDNLRQVGSYEMDRQTPFRADSVYFDVREIGGPAPAGKFAAELAAVPRTQLDPWLTRLRDIGFGIDAVDVGDAAGRAGLDLLPPEQRPRRSNPRRRLNLALAAGTVVLLVLGMNAWLHNRQAALAVMQDRVDAMHADAQRVVALRQRLSDSAGAAGFLAQRKAKAPSLLAVIEELSRRLPDDTWLERLSIDNAGQIGFQGQSPQAARLVDTLKGSTLVGEPSFQGTIQTDQTTNKERFYMVAHVRQPTPEAAHAPQAR